MDKLAGFKEVKPAQYKTIKQGDLIRYFVNNELRYGGFVKYVKLPDYIVLINYVKKVSWSVQLKQPTLKLWKKKISTNK